MGRLKQILTGKLMFVLISILLQLFLLISMIYRVSEIIYINYFLSFLSYVIVIYVINSRINMVFKLAWCVLILAFPVLGGVLYILFGGRLVPKKLRIESTLSLNETKGLVYQDEDVYKSFEEKSDYNIKKIFDYGEIVGVFPIFNNSEITYLELGEVKWKAMLKELSKAKHFIFLEYFIIKDGVMWQSILDILKEKVKDGVEVKIIFDDFGAASTLAKDYDIELEKYGIEALRFNRLRPALLVQMNNRDHRKLCVIDNNVAFCGGINIGDEYINVEERFGHWKDSAVMIKGEAVWGFTVMFFQIYRYLKDETIDFEKYRIPCVPIKNDTFVQPYYDSPTDGENVGLNIHLNLINNAKKYVYIHTPYLVIDENIKYSLMLAAKSGVDVRITTPHIPDKKYVFQITRYNYEELIEAGVKIYEYTPGFLHSKSIVVDGEVGMCGTINMDFRSYFHHYECGVLFYNSDAVKNMYEDQMNVFEVSELITLEKCRNVNIIVRFIRVVLNLIAPLL
ncbi:MAG: cardiolipin synthase [Bacillota bacterium]|nr:cardiolipin synthase [Bacillota bacterium]